jgi:hypothetical protein
MTGPGRQGRVALVVLDARVVVGYEIIGWYWNGEPKLRHPQYARWLTSATV